METKPKFHMYESVTDDEGYDGMIISVPSTADGAYQVRFAGKHKYLYKWEHQLTQRRNTDNR